MFPHYSSACFFFCLMLLLLVVLLCVIVVGCQHFGATGFTLTPRKEFATFYFTSAKACPCIFGGFSQRCELEDHVEQRAFYTP